MDKKPSVYLAQPTYDGRLNAKAQNAVMNEIINGHISANDSMRFSLLSANCNGLWCNCLNSQKEYGHTHFMMLHNDIVPEMNFGEKMLEIMERTGADILSAVVPFKNNSGLTSTAIEFAEILPRRLTLKEISRLPATFGVDDCRREIIADARALLVNTGLMIVRLDFHRVRELFFDENNWIKTTPDGKMHPQVFSEDWYFTRLASDLGARVMATREVKVEHVGDAAYSNQGMWGKETDDAISLEE